MQPKRFLIIIPLLLFCLLPYIIVLLWNNIVIDIFSIKAITYWQALGLFILCRILFGSYSFGKKHKPPFFKERLMNMSDEEKQRLKEEWKKRNTSC